MDSIYKLFISTLEQTISLVQHKKPTLSELKTSISDVNLPKRAGSVISRKIPCNGRNDLFTTETVTSLSDQE